MASLINCQQVAAYTAEEFAGDTAYGASALELQSPPAGALSSSTLPGMYYLVIESESGYHIKAENINIGGTNGLLSQSSGAYQWNSMSIVTGSVVPSDVFNIRASDSLADNTNCGNKVIIEVLLQSSFVMPASDHFINIDFGGTAESCAPTNPVIKLWKFSLLSSPPTEECPIFIAQHYESAADASNPYNVKNISYNSGNLNNQPPVWDPTGSWLDVNSEYYTGSPSALSSFNPTVYNQYTLSDTQVELFTNTSSPAVGILGSTLIDLCGSLIIENFSYGVSSINGYHPNYLENPFPSGGGGNTHNNVYSYYGSNLPLGNIPAISQVDYPFLSAGDGIYPPSVCWYVSVGSNPNYNLIASTETIDVWRIISTNHPSGGTGCNFPSGTTAFVSQKNESGVTTNNNSHFDIDNVEITQALDNNGNEDLKTVKIKCNFNSSHQFFVWEEDAPRHTKVFANIYPNEI